jgi:hypothetical protein
MAGGTTFHFVTDGAETALELARAAAGDGDVIVGGGLDDPPTLAVPCRRRVALRRRAGLSRCRRTTLQRT